MKHDFSVPLWTTPILAFCLSFLFSVVLAPVLGLVAYHQYDFWLLCAVTMLILALPLTYLEIALSIRTKISPLQGFLQLTREADSTTRWRLIAWAAALLLATIVGAMLSFATQQIAHQGQFHFSSVILFLLLVIISVALTFLPRFVLLLLSLVTALAFIGLGLNALEFSQWQWTAIEFKEWATVVILTLVTAGLGLGIYWQNTSSVVAVKRTATPIVMPIWVAQLLGLLFFALSNHTFSLAQVVLLSASLTCLSAVLLQLLRQQLLERKISLLVQVAMLLLPILIWAIPVIQLALYIGLVVLILVIALCAAIFTGWFIKISHLRKSMNFSSEFTYNIWRIFIRVVVPIAIVLALGAWLIVWLGA